jgi:hypothetical protein
MSQPAEGARAGSPDLTPTKCPACGVWNPAAVTNCQDCGSHLRATGVGAARWSRFKGWLVLGASCVLAEVVLAAYMFPISLIRRAYPPAAVGPESFVDAAARDIQAGYAQARILDRTVVFAFLTIVLQGSLILAGRTVIRRHCSRKTSAGSSAA